MYDGIDGVKTVSIHFFLFYRLIVEIMQPTVKAWILTIFIFQGLKQKLVPRYLLYVSQFSIASSFCQD